MNRLEKAKCNVKAIKETINSGNPYHKNVAEGLLNSVLDDYIELLEQNSTVSEEEWSDIFGYEGQYQISSFGRIKSLNRLVKNGSGNRYVKGKFLNLYPDNNGYLLVTLEKDGKSKRYRVHKLVADAFIEKDEDRTYINHKDFNKYNNALSNLERCTQKENAHHAKINGRYDNVFKVAEELDRTGFNRHLKRKVVQMDLNGKTIKIWDGLMDVERELGISHRNIRRACKKEHYTSGGFKWRFYGQLGGNKE